MTWIILLFSNFIQRWDLKVGQMLLSPPESAVTCVQLGGRCGQDIPIMIMIMLTKIVIVWCEWKRVQDYIYVGVHCPWSMISITMYLPIMRMIFIIMLIIRRSMIMVVITRQRNNLLRNFSSPSGHEFVSHQDSSNTRWDWTAVIIFKISVLSSSGQLKILQLILKMISLRLFGRIGEVALVRYLCHTIEQFSKKCC